MALAALVAALALLAAACGDDEPDTEQGQHVGEALTADPGATVDQPGTPDQDTNQSGTATAPAGDGQSPVIVEIPAAEQGLAFAKESVSAATGTLTLRMPNPSSVPHNIAVDEPERAVGEVVEKGGVSEITVNFPPGEYEYYCSVPGHREAGMTGTLTVD